MFVDVDEQTSKNVVATFNIPCLQDLVDDDYLFDLNKQKDDE